MQRTSNDARRHPVPAKQPAAGAVSFRRWLLLAALAWVASCSVVGGDPTGGETHFLTRCDASSECGARLSCVCGVCTLPCAEPADCEPLPAAECIEVSAGSACGDAPPSSTCDVPCSSDSDCAVVSPSHRCADGACRAGPACPTGEVGGNQVLLIGDSFFGATHQVTAYLEDLAHTAGALAVGERYRDLSAVTANTLAFGGRGIAAQYTAAAAEAPVEVVIMNGGAADALVGTCEAPTADCPVIAGAALAAAELLAQMAEGGVRQVVYAFYPDYDDVALRDKLDALRPLVEEACAGSPAPCHWVDLRPTFAGRIAEYTDASGFLPSALGAEASAQAIWSRMAEECIAQ